MEKVKCPSFGVIKRIDTEHATIRIVDEGERCDWPTMLFEVYADTRNGGCSTRMTSAQMSELRQALREACRRLREREKLRGYR